jgi:hypothetical protein
MICCRHSEIVESKLRIDWVLDAVEERWIADSLNRVAADSAQKDPIEIFHDYIKTNIGRGDI